ncbi:MAG: hypothetical protein QM791_12280 [Ferruginibacter sp.]
MTNITAILLEKYKSGEFEEIAHSVFRNKSEKNYCFTFEAELKEHEDQYPLDDLLSQYSLSCTAYYKDEKISDEIKRSTIEVETLSDGKDDLIKILNFSTIAGRTIENVEYCKYALLVLKYGMGKITAGDTETLIPLLACRNDRAGMMNFEIIYPEMQYKQMFEEGINASGLLPENCKPLFVFLKKGKAAVVFKDKEEIYRLIYGLNGYEKTEKAEWDE